MIPPTDACRTAAETTAILQGSPGAFLDSRLYNTFGPALLPQSLISMDRIGEAVRRMLRLKYRLYVRNPVATVTRPVRELRGFQRSRSIRPRVGG